MLGLSGYWVARHAFGQPAGVARQLAAAVLAWSWVTIGMLVLGSLGQLARPTLLLWTGLGLAVAALSRWFDRPADVEETKPVEPWGASAMIALGLTIWTALVFGVPSLLLPVKVVSDGPIYHLYFACRWWK